MSYLIIAHEPPSIGEATGPIVTNPEIASEIGRRTGLGEPTDPNGWGIWEVPA